MSSNPFDPAAWAALWAGRAPSLAPKRLEQSGWIFGSTINVTELNSAAPDTEAAILQTKSYGRQLGKISDALELLIEERAKTGGTQEPALDEFSGMKDEIDRIKKDAAASRITQLRKDLDALRHENPGDYERLRTELQP